MRNFITEFKKIVKKYGNNNAIITDGTNTLTYKDLYAKAIKISKLIPPNSLVAVHVNKSSDYICAILGVWLAGSAFVPLLPDLPQKRKLSILKDCNPNIILENNRTKFNTAIKGITRLNIDKAPKYENNESQRKISIYHDSLAYIIYTSGSTGSPKGVMIPHRGVLNVMEQQISKFKLDSSSRSLLFLSISFDASISDIGTVLLSGGTLFIENIDRAFLTENLFSIINKRRITHIDIPPSVLKILPIEEKPHSLKTVIIGGEKLDEQSVIKWAQKVHLINVYGPTEATICTSMVSCSPITWDGPDIGQPIKNIKYKIDQGGELLISGVGLAIGYKNKELLTKEKFPTIDGKRWYKTGDIVKTKENKIYFIGRKDRQIKINGQLVAPEEIESTLADHNNISRSAIIYNNGKLIAFVQLKNGNSNFSEKSIKRYLSERLPSWMIPKEIIFQDILSTNASGKVDFARLKQELEIRNRSPQEIVKHETLNINERISEVWKKILGIKTINEERSIFSMGADSLSALSFIIESKKIGLNFPVGILATENSIRKLSNWYENNKNKQGTISDGITASKIIHDGKLDSYWNKILTESKKLKDGNINNILLTGGNGFLGAHLIKEIISKNKNAKIFALIRANSKPEALTKIKISLESNKIKISKEGIKKIIPICGDISKEKLGLSPRDWQMISSTIGSIYHCAATVNMVKGYAELKKTNVDGAKEIVKLALTGRRKKIVYTSTLSVFVATNQNTGRVYEKDNLKKIKNIYGGYAQSKFVAEYFLQKIPKEILDIKILRLGLLTGNSKTGAMSENDYLKMFIKGLCSLSAISDGKHNSISLDVTPVDYAARLSYIVANSKNNHRIFHITTGKSFDLAIVIKALKNNGKKLKKLDGHAWQQMIKEKTNITPEESAAVMAMCRLDNTQNSFKQLRSMDLFQATNIVFDTTNTQIASIRKIETPEINEKLLNKYIKNILKK